MPNPAFGDFMKAIGAYPKLRFEPAQKKELIFINAKMIEKVDPGGTTKPALRILVQDITDNEIKQWDTESVVVADMLRHIEPKMHFTAMPTKRGAKKGWEIIIVNEDK